MVSNIVCICVLNFSKGAFGIVKEQATRVNTQKSYTIKIVTKGKLDRRRHAFPSRT